MDEANPLLSKGKASTTLKQLEIVAFGFGNIQNDICGAMVLGYLLVFHTMVLKLSNESATLIVMVSLLADGLSTILVGYLMTQTKKCWFCKKYGNLKSWLLLGTVLEIITFPLVFRKSVLYDHTYASETELVIYYGVVNTVFAFGWAVSQISHLSMITAKSSFKMDWYILTSSRNLGMVFANLVVITLFAIFLSKEKKVLPVDHINFEIIDLCTLCIGALASLTFQFYFKLEDKDYERMPNTDNSCQSLSSNHSQTSLCNPDSDTITSLPKTNGEIKEEHTCTWLRQFKFYQVAITFMISRLFYTTVQTFLPLYVEYTLKKSAVHIAIIQALVFFGGGLISFSSQKLIGKCGLETLIASGSVIGMAMAAWIYVGVGQTFNRYQVYIMVIMLGVVQSLFQICGLAKIAELVGDSPDSSSNVYGFMCFTDKLLCGISVYFFEKLAPSTQNSLGGDFYRILIVAVFSGTSILLGSISTLVSSWTYLKSK